MEGVTEQGPAPQYKPRVLVKGPGCQDVFDTLVASHASASVLQDFWGTDQRWVGRSWLSSYAGSEAERRFRELSAGLKTCPALVARTPEGQLNSRITVRKAPALGDEAVAFDLSMDKPGGSRGAGGREEATITDHHLLVRVGSLTLDVGDRGAQGDPRLSLDAVVDKQLGRIAAQAPPYARSYSPSFSPPAP
ncbi:hypothetical protein DMA15_12805 [Streptomyces sp. WAC 01529]|nr:hypothetical protein DMA15_12805 [Streptomyces sp. WAC 01529]